MDTGYLGSKHNVMLISATLIQTHSSQLTPRSSEWPDQGQRVDIPPAPLYPTSTIL